jgi:hypothetical protein
MGFSDGVRIRIGLCLIILFGHVSNMRLLGRAVHDLADIARPDEVTQYEARFRELKQVLPPHARIGYVTDLRPQGSADDGRIRRLSVKRYVLTQYALLPAIVLPGTQHGLVVSNFYSAHGIDSEETRGLTLIRDFGDGVMLFRAPSQ